MSLENTTRKLALVTGGSSGIGFCLAKEFADHGYDLLLCAENRDTLLEAADKLRATNDVRIEIVATDLSTYEGVEELYAAAKAIGPVDALAANAGTGTYGNFTEETSLEQELKIIDLNAKSVVHLTKLISKDMVAWGSGKILITASVVSFMPDAYQTVYAATKAFDYIFAEGLRESLKGTGVTVTALLPGATATNFFFRAGAMESKVVKDGGLADPADVAKVAYQALEEGDDHVVHGIKNKIMAELASMAPPTLVAKMGRMMMEPKKEKVEEEA